MFTQCDRCSTDIDDIQRLTINAIRDELRQFGDSTDGTKIILAERLQVRRLRNEELAVLYANDGDDEEQLRDIGPALLPSREGRSRMHVCAKLFWHV